MDLYAYDAISSTTIMSNINDTQNNLINQPSICNLASNQPYDGQRYSKISIRYQSYNKAMVCVAGISKIFPIKLMVEYTPLTNVPVEMLPPNSSLI